MFWRILGLVFPHFVYLVHSPTGYEAKADFRADTNGKHLLPCYAIVMIRQLLVENRPYACAQNISDVMMDCDVTCGHVYCGITPKNI